MDAKAYTPLNDWISILCSNNWSEMELRNRRYDSVFHMVSAAVGTDIYTQSNNKARFETETEAVEADIRTQLAWMGHQHLRIIDNSTNFEGKLERLWRSVEKSLENKEIERRFLVRSWKKPSNVVSMDMTRAYLKSNDNTIRRVRKCNQDRPLFYLTVKDNASNLERSESETLISRDEYNTLLLDQDPERNTIFKTRHYFIWNNRQYELDEFRVLYRNIYNGLKILEVEIDDPSEQIEIPPFISIEREITGDPTYSNWTLATRI